MKQVLQSLRKGTVQVTGVPAPLAADGMVLVRTIASLVSAGTERMVVEFAEKTLIEKARARPDLVKQVIDRVRREGLLSTFDRVTQQLDRPLPLGYSLVGEVLEVGAGITGVRPGDRVACAGAGVANHAELALVPKHLFARLPDGFTDRVPVEHAAFTTLGAIALHGFRLASPQIGDRVAVIGLGLLGQLAVQLARAAGCQVFGVDLAPDRVALALEMGAHVAVERSRAEAEALAFAGGTGMDVVLIAADAKTSDPIELAATIARDRATVISIGAVDLTVPRTPYFKKELDFRVSRSYGPGRYDPAYELHGHDYPIGYVRWTEQRNLQAIVEQLAGGGLRVERLITHRFPIDEAPKAYDIITGKAPEPFLGVLLTYPGSATTATRVELPPAAAHRAAAIERPRVGVVGAGVFATATMLPALERVPGIVLRGVAAASGLSARTAAESAGFAYCSTDDGEVLRDPETDVVFVLTRHDLHARQVIAALEAGKHVLVEKPLCLTPDELDAIVQAQAAHPSQLLMVGFNRRFAPMARQMRDFLADSAEPMVLTYRCNAGYLPPDHWTQDPAIGGGRLVGEGCHFIDFANWMQGEAPAEVFARAMDDAGRYRQDNFAITMSYPSGGLATILYVANGDRQAGKERVEVHRGGRTAVLDDFRQLRLMGAGRTRTIAARLRADKGHHRECAELLDAIRKGRPSPIPFGDVVASMRATFAAAACLRTGQPVGLSESPSRPA